MIILTEDVDEYIDDPRFWQRQYGALAGFTFRIVSQAETDFKWIVESLLAAREATHTERIRILNEVITYCNNVASILQESRERIEENTGMKARVVPAPDALKRITSSG